MQRDALIISIQIKLRNYNKTDPILEYDIKNTQGKHIRDTTHIQ